MRIHFIILALTPALAACEMGQSTTADGTPLLARPTDSAVNNTDLLSDRPMAIAVDPDGCMHWVGDDGAEGYANARYDPVTGEPVCTDRLPPGAVISDPQRTGFIDILP
jgi:hypothetical protein